MMHAFYNCNKFAKLIFLLQTQQIARKNLTKFIDGLASLLYS